MARAQNRKRQHEGDDVHPSEKIKAAGYRDPSNFSPDFWENLSKIWLTPRALRELDRRNHIRPVTEPRIQEKIYSEDLARFARHGGPDLQHLRGLSLDWQNYRSFSANVPFQCPMSKRPRMAALSRSSGSSKNKGEQPASATTLASHSRKSSAYDDNFEVHMNDNEIFLNIVGANDDDDDDDHDPENLGEILERLSRSRESLSPSCFPDSAFRDFRRKNGRVSEDTVLPTVIPIIAGNTDIPNEGHLPFTNLESLTNGEPVKPVPDYFDGASWRAVDSQVRNDLDKTIIPTKHAMNAPIVPNFFLEAKAPREGTDVARRQAGYDGAYGARAMHCLQNYGNDELIYDNNTYAFSSTYHDGALKLYAHHLTAPTTPGGHPVYYMTQLNGYQLTGNSKTFREGVAALRNVRALAKEYRDSFIHAANARVREDSQDAN
ncbi:hypothetical protein ONZ43_g7185 [Nemania bipapillata]|uniref:Uncharacterized protein n=1 Tax=Nemania bipapillata TaxID=110536 RepID=A0ACC2HTE5_9PEZI|nr:hypothetical protein ONZ43_g7185 [Nemania bipapillata]